MIQSGVVELGFIGIENKVAFLTLCEGKNPGSGLARLVLQLDTVRKGVLDTWTANQCIVTTA
jgi:hypothetical protein